ncbi:MAG: flavin monoamine oxidase family protein [Gemmatimonadales bacterium]
MLVIGAGVAGLAAAERLASAGRRVILIEARDRIGGRIHTILEPGFPYPIELGAEFIHGGSPELWDAIGAGGLAVDEVPQHHVRTHGGDQRPLPDLRQLVGRVLGPHPETAPDRSFREVLKERVAKDMDPADAEAALRYVEGFHAADAARLGTRALADNESGGSADDQRQFRVRDGYAGIVGWLATRLDPGAVTLRLGTAATGLHWRPGEVRLTAVSPDGRPNEVTAGRAIITVPLALLKAGAGGLALPIAPRPPGWDTALAALEMGAACRIVLRFDQPWWEQAAESDANFFHGSREAFPVWWTAAPARRPVLTGWAGGSAATALAGLSMEELRGKALASLTSLFDVNLRTLEAHMLAGHAHDWAGDPFSRGAYSYGGVGAVESRHALAQPVADTLFLAGEAIAGRGSTGTVHGALESGRRAAARALEV